MLLSSISSTKKFFQKTIKNFKSFFSPGYQRLPKASPHSHFSYSVAAASMDMTSNTSYHDMEKLYTDFSDQWESENEKASRRRIKKKAASSALPSKQESEVYSGSYISLSNTSHAQKKNKKEKKEEEGGGNNKTIHHQKGRQRKESSSSLMSMCMKGEHKYKYCMVEQKLRELEMLDMNNVEYILDIEEVLHYYSRLTCPAYLEIVDKFFLEMYSELFGPSSMSMWHASPRTRTVNNSRLKMRYQ